MRQPVPAVLEGRRALVTGGSRGIGRAICSAAKGEKNPSAEDFEKVTDKSKLVKALGDSIAYCDQVHAAMNDCTGAEVVEVFGRKRPKLGVLNINVTHSS